MKQDKDPSNLYNGKRSRRQEKKLRKAKGKAVRKGHNK